LGKRENKNGPILQSGKIEDYEALFRQYYPQLVSYACKYLADVDVAREIVQDFFVRLFEKKDSIFIDTSIKSYLFRSVYNCCMNYINHRAIQEKHLKNILADETDENLENEIHTVELQKKIFEIIEKLPVKCRRIFKMNRLEGMKNEEIARELNLSKRTVETQISKALKILRSKLSDYLTLILYLSLFSLPCLYIRLCFIFVT
jgi:RNA polymerase sigma-70 factor (ECF subfamily)